MCAQVRRHPNKHANMERSKGPKERNRSPFVSAKQASLGGKGVQDEFGRVKKRKAFQGSKDTKSRESILASRSGRVVKRPSLLGWRPFVGWRPSLVGKRPLL